MITTYSNEYLWSISEKRRIQEMHDEVKRYQLLTQARKRHSFGVFRRISAVFTSQRMPKSTSSLKQQDRMAERGTA